MHYLFFISTHSSNTLLLSWTSCAGVPMGEGVVQLRDWHRLRKDQGKEEMYCTLSSNKGECILIARLIELFNKNICMKIFMSDFSSTPPFLSVRKEVKSEEGGAIQ